MRVREIKVEGLFDTFDHIIPLNLDDHITIIHGPNGFGKTILLQMIHGLLRGSMDMIVQIPFKKFEISFDDNSRVWIEKPESNELVEQIQISNGKYTTPLNVQEFHNVLPKSWPSLPKMEDTQNWSDWMLDPTEVFKLLGNLPKYVVEIPEWWLELRKSTPAHLVDTERLLTIERGITTEKTVHEVLEPVVKLFAGDLSRRIHKKFAQYAKISQELDQTYPKRITEQFGQVPSTNEQVQTKLQELKNQQKLLEEVDLIQVFENIILPDTNENVANIMMIYIHDMQQKLNVFNDLVQKINLFKDIINKRFLYKAMEISSQVGFLFKDNNDKILPVTTLSSGEQHELVLFYQLIFKMPPNSLILIDEPELSLHVAWQQHFLRDLQRIIALSPFDVLMATHSPQIIHDRWDLTVELKGKPS